MPLSGSSSPAAADWNAADAARSVPRPGVLERLAMPRKHAARRALRDAGARRLAADERPRYRNLADGLAARAGQRSPDLWVIPDPAPNAMTCKLDRATLALSDGLLDSFTRTEIEAVVAHCLVRARVAGRRGVTVGYDDDVRAAALTRYPPALAAALGKATPYEGRYASFYLVANGRSHRPVEERIQALLDL